MRKIQSFVLVALTLLAALATSPAQAADRAETVSRVRAQGINFLRNAQAADGSWTSSNTPGISGLVVRSLLESGLDADDPTVALGIKHLLTFVREDGGIYANGSIHRNYETCIVLMTLVQANADGRYDPIIKNADHFLRELQWDQGEGLESTDPGFGGAGYGKHERPDLSNTQFLIEALKTGGAGPDDPALQKALKFVSSTQNLESPHNTTKFAPLVNDGGHYYTSAAGGSSQAGTTANGGLRSYGSMTYAGLKSMIYAGLDMNDKRVKAAFQWISNNYTVRENPGLGQQGLFYYYHTLAKTLDVLKVEQLKDADGTEHDWRTDLVNKLDELQKSNGSWVNAADRWYESDPNLVTAYALLALSHCD